MTRMTWVAWSPSGDLLVTLGEQNIIWNSDRGRVATLFGQPGGCHPKFSPSGSLVAMIRASTFYSHCDVYNTITGELLKSVNSFTWHDSVQNAVVWKDEVSFFCSGDNDTINLWKADQDEPIDVIRETQFGVFMAFNPEKDILAFSGFQGTIWLYSSGVTTGTLNGHSAPVLGLVWKPDFSGILASRALGGQVRIWDTLGKTTLHIYEMAITLLGNGIGNFYGLIGISFSPDWSFFATVDVDENAKIVRVDTGEIVAECEEKGVAVSWSTNGDKLAVRPDQGLNEVKNVSVYSLAKIIGWKNLKVLSTMRVATVLETKLNKDEAEEFLQNKEGFLPALVPDVCAYLPQN